MKRIFLLSVFIWVNLCLFSLNLHKIENDNPGGNLGYRVKLDGDVLASAKYISASVAGGVMIYNRNLGGENNWGEEDYLFSPHAAGPGDYFGESIDLYDDLLIVGRPGGVFDEKAFIFQRQQDPTTLEWSWNLIRTLDPSEAPEIDEDEDDNIAFGWSVAINDEWAVVGAPLDDSENGNQPLVGVDAGAIYTWRKVDGVWEFYDKWTAYLDEQAEFQDKLGWSVDVWGNKIIAGALYADIKDPDPPFDVKENTGAAYLLRPFDGVWLLTTKLQAPFEEADLNDHFGNDVAIWGSRMVVGAPNHTGGGGNMSHYGAAFSYFHSIGVDLERVFYDPDPQQSSNFGAKVGVFRNALLISNEGQRRYYPDGSPPADYQVGVAYHYGLCTDGRFRLLHTLWPQNYAVEYGDNFACDVAMDEHYYMSVGSFTDDGGGNGAGATYVYWSGNNYGEPGDGTESEEDDGSGETNGGATGEGSIFPAPYVDCVIINEYEADPEIPDRDIQQWVELLVIAEDGVDMRHWLLTDIDPSDLYEGVLMPPGLNEAFIRFNDYPEFADIPGGTTIVIFDGNGPTNDLDPSDGTMFIYTESEYLSRVPYSFYTIQLDIANDNLTLWADDDGVWDIENSIPIDHISWGDPLIEPPYGIDWGDYIDDGSEYRAVSNSYFSDGDNTINDDALNWFTDGTSSQGSLNPGQIYSGSGWQPDPSNHVLDFSADATGFYSVEVTWTENDGSVVADGYLLAASTASISDPIDGYQAPEDTDISDGSACVYLPHGTNSYSFSNCSPLTTYNFKIYPYTGAGSLINYKTDGTVPEDDATTPSDILEPSPGDLIITEVVGKDATSYEFSGFIEFTNTTEYPINLNDVTVRYYDDSSIPTATYDLSGTIEPNDYLVICQNEDYFTLAYGMTADFILPFYYHTWPWTSLFNLDGGEDAIDFYLDSGRSEIIDQFNDPADVWSWNSDDVLERVADTPGTAQSDWFNPGGTGTPGTGGNQSLSSPQNVIITTDIDNVNISWDEVTGADSYIVYSSDNPETGFVEDTSGSFSVESWTAPAPEIKRFYHVRAVQNEE